MRSEVFTAMRMQKMFWILSPCNSPVDATISEKHAVSIFRADVSSKYWYLPAGLHGIVTQNNNMVISDCIQWGTCGVTSFVTVICKCTKIYIKANNCVHFELQYTFLLMLSFELMCLMC
jgi:hypothetical protein